MYVFYALFAWLQQLSLFLKGKPQLLHTRCKVNCCRRCEVFCGFFRLFFTGILTNIGKYILWSSSSNIGNVTWKFETLECCSWNGFRVQFSILSCNRDWYKKGYWPKIRLIIKIYNFYPFKLIFRQFYLLMSWSFWQSFTIIGSELWILIIGLFLGR